MVNQHDLYTILDAEEEIAALRGQVDRLSEVVSLLTSGPTPAATAGTVQVYAGNGSANAANLNVPAWVDPSGLSMGCVGAQQCWFPGNTVTGASLANLASWTIPANAAQTSSIFETEIWGNGQQGSTAQILNLSAVLGGNTMATIQIGASFMNVSLIFRWYAKVRAICHTTGTSGTWSSMIQGNISLYNGTLLSSGSSSNNPTNSFFSCEAGGTTTLSTQQANNFGLSGFWNSTTGAPTLTSQVAIAKKIC